MDLVAVNVEIVSWLTSGARQDVDQHEVLLPHGRGWFGSSHEVDCN